MIICTRRLEFDSAHRVMNHESKCKMLHGHRYVVEASFTAKELDSLGRIVDFGLIREILGSWIDKNLDHTTILWDKDRELGEKISNITGQKIYYMKYNPTAENIAKHLLEDICPTLFSSYPIECVNIKVYETPNCFAQISSKNNGFQSDSPVDE
ncbi:MAG: 6-carboxytetrahydropterin synthase [Alphaproteobacteria bacterium]|nr:6-carboxytetrahydropterin synthase [Alphaproteobacteria bacterium]